MNQKEAGYTLVELMVVMAILAVLTLATYDLFISLLHSAVVASQDAIATTLATNQMEYLQSLPYDNLAVQGGPIISSTYIPGTITKKVQGYTYTIVTNINYVDDAYDGCGSYPNLTLEKEYCRNYPPPSGAPSPGDTDDYKDVNVSVKGETGNTLASQDTDIASLVAETASNTGSATRLVERLLRL
jgi:prepilin-type N-terminal cleavage/methylation domain-containing protein